MEKINSQRPTANSNTKSTILYMDTSEPEAIVRIYDGEKALAEEKWLAHRELSATLSQKYSDILANVRLKGSDLTGVVVFVGPGSFTGLRIGIAFANALAYALKIPVYGTKERGGIDLSQPKKIALPFYGAEPNITKSKK